MKILSLAFAALAFAGAAIAAPITVESCERQVVFDSVPKAAVVHDVNLVEMMLALDLSDRMVGYTGISGWHKLDDGLRKGIDDLPELAPRYPSREVLVGSGADFFFAGWNYGMRVGGEVTPDTLAPFGIKVYELTESCVHIGPRKGISIEDMYRDLLNLGKIFDIEARAETLVAKYRSEVEEILGNLPELDRPIRVFLYDSGEEGLPFTAGRYAMPTALIEASGGVNVTDDLEKSWSTVSWESVVERDPELIVIVDYGSVSVEQKWNFLKSQPALNGMSAIRDGRFLALEYNEVTPGPRNIAAIAKLAAAIRNSQSTRGN